MAVQQQTANEQGTTEQQQEPTASGSPIVPDSLLAGPQEQAQPTGWTPEQRAAWRTPDQQAAWIAMPPAVLQNRAQPAPGAWQAAGQQQRLNQLYQHLAVPEMGAEAASEISTQELMSVLEGDQTAPAILIQTALLHSILIKCRQLEKAVHFLERR